MSNKTPKPRTEPVDTPEFARVVADLSREVKEGEDLLFFDHTKGARLLTREERSERIETFRREVASQGGAAKQEITWNVPGPSLDDTLPGLGEPRARQQRDVPASASVRGELHGADEESELAPGSETFVDLRLRTRWRFPVWGKLGLLGALALFVAEVTIWFLRGDRPTESRIHPVVQVDVGPKSSAQVAHPPVPDEPRPIRSAEPTPAAANSTADGVSAPRRMDDPVVPPFLHVAPAPAQARSDRPSTTKKVTTSANPANGAPNLEPPSGAPQF
jgi:hypothetical protein